MILTGTALPGVLVTPTRCMDDPQPNFWYYGAARIPEDASSMHPWQHIGRNKHTARSNPGPYLQLNGQKALAALRLLPGTFRVARPFAGSSLVHLPHD